jgi:hypothetical protein
VDQAAFGQPPGLLVAGAQHAAGEPR